MKRMFTWDPLHRPNATTLGREMREVLENGEKIV
jgi:hypothetical protein